MTNEFVGTGNGELYKSAFDFDEINKQGFDSVIHLDGRNIANQAAKYKDSIEELKLQVEEKDEEKEATAALVELGEAQQDQREAALERAREEAWDNSMHDVAGIELSGEAIDSIIETIKNPTRKAEIIAKRAKDKNISTEEAEKQLNMTLAYLEAKKRIDKGQGTNEDKALVDEINRNPEKSKIINENTNEIQRFNTNQNTPTPVTTEQKLAVVGQGGESINARTDLMNHVKETETTNSTSAASQINNDGIKANSLTPNFNEMSFGQTKPETINQSIPANDKQMQTAQNKLSALNQTAGML